MIYPKMLNILSQAYTLPPLRDDLALSYQIQNFSDPAHLAKRQYRVATLYWDRNGNIKAVFNMQIGFIVAQILENLGENLGQSVLTALQVYVTMAAGPAAYILDSATWSSQIGRNWRSILREFGGQTTIGVLVRLPPSSQIRWHTILISHLMQAWFTFSGFIAFLEEVEDASLAGNAGIFRIERRSLTERQTVEARSDSKFCKPMIQNWQFVLTPGKLDTLLAPLITC